MKKILFVIVLFMQSIINAQTAPCLTDEVINNLVMQNPEMQGSIDGINILIKQKYAASGKSTYTLPAPGSVLIPVVFYVVYDSNVPSTNVSDQQVGQQLQALNDKFYNSGIKFCKPSSNIPLNPSYFQSQTSPGIVRFNDVSMSEHNTNSNDLLNMAHISVTGNKYLRIWIVKSINGSSSGILGYAYPPNGSSFYDGVVITSNVCGSSLSTNLLANFGEGETLVHEVGHYLGLKHTFEGGCITTYNDCRLDGDLVCDTPAIASMNLYCNTTRNSCVESPPVYDAVKNYMDYGTNVCADNFTTGQMERMNYTLATYRAYLCSNDNLINTGATCGNTNLISATIVPDRYMVCQSSGLVNFKATQGQAQYSWNFGDPASGASNVAAIYNPAHTFSSSVNSPYTVTLTVTANNGATASSTIKIYVTDCAGVPVNSDSYWFVDRSAGLSFANGLPTWDSSFPLVPNMYPYAVASVGKTDGSLLFYTDGRGVWNNSHTKLNTTDISVSTVNGTYDRYLIVPNPGNANQYYVFSTNSFSNSSHTASTSSPGLEYSIVELTNGNATSVPVQRQPVTTPAGYDPGVNGAILSCGLSAIKKCNGDYWIVTTLIKNNRNYLATYSLTATGLTFVTGSDTGMMLNGTSAGSYKIEAAPNGNKIFVYAYGTNCVYDFNKTNGTFSKRSTIIYEQYKGIVAASFSPDSNLLYTRTFSSSIDLTHKIYQYKLNAPVPDNTRILIATKEQRNLAIRDGDMQIGPDNKIYATGLAIDALSVIHQPNVPVTSTSNLCGFAEIGIQRPSSIPEPMRDMRAIPNLIDAKQETAYPTAASKKISIYSTNCKRYKFFPNVCGTSFNWIFYNSTVNSTTTSGLTNPELSLATGAYTITLKDNTNTIVLATATLQVSAAQPTPVISGNTSACLTENSTTSHTTALSSGETALWTVTGGTILGANNEGTVNINWTSLPGTVSVVVTSQEGCISPTASKTITSLCACECLSTLSVKMTPQLSDNFKFTVINSNPSELCSQLNLKYIWTFPNGATMTTTTGVVTVMLQQEVSVVIQLLSPTGNVICSVMRSYATNSPSNGKMMDGNVLNLDPSNKVIISPNPSKGHFNVHIDDYAGRIAISIIDANGKEVFNEEDQHFQTDKMLNLTHLSSGIYILTVNGQNISSTQKIIKN